MDLVFDRVNKRYEVLLFLTFLCDPRATTARRAQEKRQVDAVHARPLALLAVALAVEISPLLLGRLLLGRLRGRDLRGDGVRITFKLCETLKPPPPDASDDQSESKET